LTEEEEMELLNTDQLNEKIKVTDGICPTHQINLVQFKKPDGYTLPYCMECTRENIKQTELDGVEKALGHDLNQSTYDVLDRESTVSNELKKATFSTFKADTKEEHEAKEFAIKQAKQYLNGMTGNTLIMGKPGTGKSHLTYSMAKVINEGYKAKKDPQSVLFISIAEIVTRIQSGWQYKYSDFTEHDALKLLTEVDFLFVDDLGSESIMNSRKDEANNWMQTFLFKIFDKRETTIVNTNHTGKELAQIYNDKLVSRIGKRSEGNVFTMAGITDKRMKRNF
jgi:zinc finger protein